MFIMKSRLRPMATPQGTLCDWCGNPLPDPCMEIYERDPSAYAEPPVLVLCGVDCLAGEIKDGSRVCIEPQ